MKLYLIRHGQSLANLHNIVQGQLDMDLTDEGYEQAQKLGERFQNNELDHIYASPLRRAYLTAQAINQHHNKEILVDERLKEVSNGVEEGRQTKRIPEEINIQYTTNPDFKFDEGESMNEVIKRIKPFYEQLLEKHKGENVAVIVHGGVIRAFLALHHKIEELNQDNYKPFRDEWSSHNTAVFEIDYTNEPVIITKNCVKHLDE